MKVEDAFDRCFWNSENGIRNELLITRVKGRPCVDERLKTPPIQGRIRVSIHSGMVGQVKHQAHPRTSCIYRASQLPEARGC
jgi:hypothetical protein